MSFVWGSGESSCLGEPSGFAAMRNAKIVEGGLMEHLPENISGSGLLGTKFGISTMKRRVERRVQLWPQFKVSLEEKASQFLFLWGVLPTSMIQILEKQSNLVNFWESVEKRRIVPYF